MDLSSNDPLETLDHIIPSKAIQDPSTTVRRFRTYIITLVLEIRLQQKRAESGEATESGDQDGQTDRFSSGNSPRGIADSSSATEPLAITSRSPSPFSGKPSIAAATILGIITFAALLFLSIWYIRHRRRRRQHKLVTQNQDFGQSEITLAEDTSKTLDDFLMKDVPLARTSLMFSRSRSPSITFVVDEAERSGLNKQGRNSYAASSNSLTKLETLTRISTDGPRPSLLSSELTTTTATSATSSSKPASTSSATPRASMSSSQLWTTITSSTDCPSTITPYPPSSATPTTRSSQVWTTTTVSTETSSMTSCENQSRLSNASRASSRLSSQGGARLSNAGNTSLRRYHARSGSRSSQNTVVLSSTAELESSGSGQLPSNPSTPSPLFRFSEEAG